MMLKYSLPRHPLIKTLLSDKHSLRLRIILHRINDTKEAYYKHLIHVQLYNVKHMQYKSFD